MPRRVVRLVNVIVIVAVLLVARVAAHAAPNAPTTVVLVHAPETLVDAVTSTLAPWQVRVVVVDDARSSTPEELAHAHAARHVVVFRAGALELREIGGATQTRPVPTVVDDVEAEALALTIKSWMRLGPIPDGIPDAPPPPPPPAPTPRRAWSVEALAGAGARLNQGGFGTHAVAAITAGVTTRWLDALVRFEMGPSVALPNGEWAQAVVSVGVGYRVPLRRVWVRPMVGLSLASVTIDGTHAMSGRPIEKSTSFVGFDASVDVLYRRGRWLATAGGGVTVFPSGQEFKGSFVLDVDGHLEPWVRIAGGLQFP